jgi:hypothetical protein
VVNILNGALTTQVVRTPQDLCGLLGSCLSAIAQIDPSMVEEVYKDITKFINIHREGQKFAKTLSMGVKHDGHN